MASDPRAQHYVECTQCTRNAEYYCNTCTDRLCQKCRKKHLISNASKYHDVILYQDKQTSATSVESCQIHPDHPYTMCCQQCEVPVCQKCIDQNHKKHTFCHIDVVYEPKKKEYKEQVFKLKNQLLPQCSALLKEVQTDNTKIKEEIAKIQSTMTSKAQVLKDIIDTVLAENTDFLQGLEHSLISELQKQESTMNNHITYLQNIVDEYEKYISTNKHAEFILFQNQNPLPAAVKEIPKLKSISVPSFNSDKVAKEDISRIFGQVQESTKPPSKRKVKNIQKNVKKMDTLTTLIPTATKLTSFTVPGVSHNHHISPISTKQAWVSDSNGSLVLTDINGKKLNEMKYSLGRYGCHTPSQTGDLFFLNGPIYKATPDSSKPKVIINVGSGIVTSMYSSPATGDILVGVENPARIIRYKKTGQEAHQIQNDTTGQPLYDRPIYITENHINGDVCASDFNKSAVVVVDKDGNHRFSYTGHPQGSELQPYGISTDLQGHILVCDGASFKVHMINKDGNFLSFLLTTDWGGETPAGLTLDERNNILWVGERNNGKSVLSIYRYHSL